MEITVLGKGNRKTAVVRGDAFIGSVGDALDLLATASSVYRCESLLLRREMLSPAFFDLKSGLAGEILQKYVNYRMRLAIVGDFSDLKSKSLRDFIYESNKGNHIFFLPTEEEALQTLWHRGGGAPVAPPVLLCYDKCSTCAKARAWLEERGIDYLSRPIREENPKAGELRHWQALSGLPLKRFFNTSGLLYKEQKLKDRLPGMSAEEQLELLASDGMLVKRPLLVGEEFVLVGFREQEWADRLGR